MFALRKFTGVHRLADVEQMTLTEFFYQKHAQDYREVDREFHDSRMAFLYRNVQATKNTGTEKKPKEEYVYASFKDFYDYEKQLKELEAPGKKPEPPGKKPEPAPTVSDGEKRLQPHEIAMRRNKRKA